MVKRRSLIGIFVVLFLMATCVYAQGPITNPGFENTNPFGYGTGIYGWDSYSYEVVPGETPALPEVGGIGFNSTFDLLVPPYVPDESKGGINVCGLQSEDITKNGGVSQSFYWAGGAARISVSVRAFSSQLPSDGGEIIDNDCRVRMALVPFYTSNRNDVPYKYEALRPYAWITAPWNCWNGYADWQTLTVRVPGPGTYTLFIEGYQPTIGTVSSTLWDNVVFTPFPSVEVQYGPELDIDTAAEHPDETMVIRWTTDVPSTSKVDYGLVGENYSQTYNDNLHVTNHVVTLTNLTPSSSYHCRITSSALADHTDWVSQDIEFKTPTQFSSPVAVSNGDGTNVLVTWFTDVPTTSQVSYGIGVRDQLSNEDLNLTKNHSIILTGLAEDENYIYRVIGRNQPAYTDAMSTSDAQFHTLPSARGSLENGDFEQLHAGVPSVFPWVKYDLPISGSLPHSIDGIVESYHITSDEPLVDMWVSPYDGTHFAGAAANFDFKRGGLFQRINCTAGELVTLSARYVTYNLGGSMVDTSLRLGIDPNGGIDPKSSSIRWWKGASQTNDSQWHQASITTKAGNNGVLTAFLDIQQNWANTWHVVAFDGVTLGTPPVMSVGQLKSSTTNLTATLEDKIITYVYEGTLNFGEISYKKIYLQDDNRTSGICVYLDQSNISDIGNNNTMQVGNKITVTGSLDIFDKEAVFVATNWMVDHNSYPLPAPLAMNQKSVGGSAANQPALGYGSKGLCNVGLRVRLFGKIDGTGLPEYGIPSYNDSVVYFDDGSKLLDHSPAGAETPVYGIRAELKASYYYFWIMPGDYLTVTGVLTTKTFDPDEDWGSGDEYSAYNVLTGSGDDWSVVSAEQ